MRAALAFLRRLKALLLRGRLDDELREEIVHARIRGGGATLAAMDAAARSVDPRILVDSAVLLG